MPLVVELGGKLLILVVCPISSVHFIALQAEWVYLKTHDLIFSISVLSYMSTRLDSVRVKVEVDV